MKTPKEVLELHLECFTGNGDYCFFYVSPENALIAMTEYADQFKNPPKKTIEERKWQFGVNLDEVIGQPHCYSQITIDFFDYWTEHSEGAKKMRFEKEKVFDIKKRLERWKRNQNQPHGNQPKRDTSEAVRDWLGNG